MVYVATLLLVAALVAVLVLAIREPAALAVWASASTSLDASREAAEHLPEPHRGLARAFLERATTPAAVDESLALTVTDAANERFGPPAIVQAGLQAVLLMAAVGPVSFALLRAATEVRETYAATRALETGLVYLQGQTRLGEPFDALRDAFQSGAWHFTLLVLIWAAHWLLARPEVREARLVRALLEVTARLQPADGAPVGTRLAETLAPDRGLVRPVAATVLCALGLTLGFVSLHQTARVRAANAEELVFDVWPAKRRTPVETPSNLILPSLRSGGAPLPAEAPPSVVLGLDEARFQDFTLAFLKAGELPDGWGVSAPDLTAKIAQYRKNDSPLVLLVTAHQPLPIVTVAEVLSHLSSRYGVDRYVLVAERNVKSGAPGGARLQAALPLRLGGRSAAPAPGHLRVSITGAGIKDSSSDQPMQFEDPRWRYVLRDHAHLLKNQQKLRAVELDVGDEIALQRMVEVMGAVDSVCETEVDCGLPGLGLEFVLLR